MFMKFLNLKFLSSLKTFSIHIWYTSLFEYTVALYSWSVSFIAVNILVKSKEKGFVEHLLEPDYYLSLYGFLWNSDI